MGRYTLEYENNPVEKYTKVRLEEIDNMTLNFSSSKEVIEHLGLKGINLRSLRIYYKQDKYKRYLDVALDNATPLKRISISSSNKIVDDSLFNSYILGCLNLAMNNFEFRSLIYNSRLSEYIKNDIIDYIEEPDNYRFMMLKNKLSSYLQFRYLVQLMDEFTLSQKSPAERELINSKRLGKIEEESDDLSYEKTDRYKYDLENFTDAEIEDYKKELDSLPDNVPSYMDVREYKTR